MKKILFIITLFTVFFAAGVSAQQSGRTTRYWDSCKPSCAWSNAGTCKDCDVRGNNLSGRDIVNACGGGGNPGGPAYTCMYQVPWAVNDNLAYGFAASHTNGDCGKCFELTFTNTAISGKKMVVMVSNIGGDVGQTQFDLMIPGGGVGIYNSLTQQLQQNGVSNPNLGAQYGGFRQTCGANESCIRQMCDNNFGTAALADMKAGCYWFIDWFKMADNPNITYTSVNCPAELSGRYNGTITTAGGGGGTTPTNYTLTVNRNPNNVGSVTVGNTAYTSPRTFASGTSVAVAATASTGYTFSNWTATSGSMPSGVTATSASISFSMPSSNLTLQANFTQTVATHTIQVGRSPTAGGNVSMSIGGGNPINNPTGSQTHNAGTPVALTATASAGYTFTNWTAQSGTSLPAGITATNSNITFTLNSNVNIVANFQQTTVTPTTYTVQASRNPTAGGSVSVNGTANPASALSFNEGTSVTMTATAGEGYTFANWTAASGSLPAGITNTSATITFTLNSNVNLRANFTQSGGSGDGPYTVQVGRNPTAGGSVSVNGTNNPAGSQTHNAWTWMTITATANTDYTFTHWAVESGSLPTDINTNNASISYSLTSNVSLTAHFQLSSGGGGDRTDTTKVEAEDYESRVGSNMQTNSNSDGVTCIGYIENGYSATYTVGIANSSAHTMVFKIASNWDQGNSRFNVVVNGSTVGEITGHTNDWDGYTYVTLSADVQFNAGNNTIVLNFQSPVNVDYFLILGAPASLATVRHGTNRVTANVSQVMMRAGVKGFTAILPANHGYTSYKLIDLQGREIKRGTVSSITTDLQFNNLKSGVIFLRLEGRKGLKTAVRATVL
ncbi:MAG: hypothetical protein LBI42_09230 [Chitinispirillales bacterium]|jgi:uncharacterized repeat protein (TIGR02543 family)|nr:hypothetical protein [Chitinispirillales bacterium]